MSELIQKVVDAANVVEKQQRIYLTLGAFKTCLKNFPGLPIYVWSNWQGEDGDYIQVSRSAFLLGIGADVAYHRGGRHNATQMTFDKRDDGIYIN